jgi:hypothetical protein
MFIRPMVAPTTGGYTFLAGGMVDFSNGSDYYQSPAFGVSLTGNKITMVLGFNSGAFTGGGQAAAIAAATTDGRHRARVNIHPDDDIDPTVRGKITVSTQGTTTPTICHLVSKEAYTDGLDHVVFYSFDGDNGLATFYIDGVNADDTTNASRIAPTAEALRAGAAYCVLGGAFGVATLFNTGKAGFYGVRNAYLTNPLDFLSATGPDAIDEVGWTEWGAKPAVWNYSGLMIHNAGSGDPFNTTGTPTLTQGDTYDFPMMSFLKASAENYYVFNANSSGNSISTVFRFNTSTRPSAQDTIISVVAGGASRLVATYLTDGKLRFICRNAASGNICYLNSIDAVDDGLYHTVFFSYNATTGAATYLIDGVSADDLTFGSRVVTTGTLASGAGTTNYGVAGYPSAQYYDGKLGYLGIIDAELTNPEDFFFEGLYTKELDETTWTEFGAQPRVWHKYGQLTASLGTEGVFTATGSITGPD